MVLIGYFVFSTIYITLKLLFRLIIAEKRGKNKENKIHHNNHDRVTFAAGSNLARLVATHGVINHVPK